MYSLNLGLPRIYNWHLVVADVKVPIIGADFLQHYHLSPDLNRRRLIDVNTLCSTKCKVANASVSIHLINAVVDERVQVLFNEFPALIKPPVYHEKPLRIFCIIFTPMDFQSLIKRVRKEFENMVRSGICSPSCSEWSSPLVVIEKKNDIRIVGDYRRLNNCTIPDRYPIPDLRDCTNHLSGKSVYSKIDLVRAYHNIPIYKKHSKKNCFNYAFWFI